MLYDYCCYAYSTFGGELLASSSFFSSMIGMSYFGGGLGLFSAPTPSAGISSKLPSFSGSFWKPTSFGFSLKLNWSIFSDPISGRASKLKSLASFGAEF